MHVRNSPSGKELDVVGSSNTVVADLAALALLPVSVDVSDLVWVDTLLVFWHRNPLSTLAPNGITVIPALGGGNWERMGETTSPQWLTQATWHINATTGDDENDGLTAGTALATHAELVRRWGDYPNWSVAITVHIDSDLNEQLVIRGRSTAQLFPRYIGTTTVVLSGTLTGYNGFIDGVQAQDVTAVELVGYVPSASEFLRYTSGAADGCVGFPYALPGGGAGQVGLGATGRIAGFPFITGWGNTAGGIGDTFDIEHLPVVAGLLVDIDYGLDAFTTLYQTCLVYFENISFFGGGAFSNGPISITGVNFDPAIMLGVVFNRCSFTDNSLAGGSARYFNCWARFTGGLPPFKYGVNDHSGSFNGCVLNGGDFRNGEYGFFNHNTVVIAGLTFTFGSRFQGGFVTVGATGAQSMMVDPTSTAIFGVGGEATYGTNTTALSVALVCDGRAWYEAVAKPTFTGAAGDTVIGGTAKAWAVIPFVEPANNAMLVILP